LKTFSNVTHELPKFADEQGDNKKWWTKRSDYNPDQTTKSAKEFNLKKMKCFSGSVEPMVIADHSDQLPPQDTFKSVYVKQ
jgi:hypothetical protein